MFHVKKGHLHAQQKVSFTYNPGAPFGRELMAERKRRGHVLKCYNLQCFPLENTANIDPRKMRKGKN